jgi:hypothetical protein
LHGLGAGTRFDFEVVDRVAMEAVDGFCLGEGKGKDPKRRETEG